MRFIRALGGILLRCRDGLLAVAGIAALIGLVAWIATHANAQKQANEGVADAFVPVNAPCLIHVRVADVANSGFGKLWIAAGPAFVRDRDFVGNEPMSLAAVFDQVFAVPADQIETMLIAQTRSPSFAALLTLEQFERFKYQPSPFQPMQTTATYMTTKDFFKQPTGTKALPETPQEQFPKRTSTIGATSGPAAHAPQTFRGTVTTFGTAKASPEMEMLWALERQPLVILHVKEAKALDRAQALASKHALRKVYKDMGYHVPRGGHDDAVLFINGRTMVRGPESLIRRGIDLQKNPPKGNARLEALHKNANKHVWMDYQRDAKAVPAGPRDEFRDDIQQLSRMIAQLQPLLAVKSKQVSLQLSRDVLLETRTHFGTAAEAEKGIKALRDFVHLYRLFEAGGLMTLLDREAGKAIEENREEALVALRLFLDQFEDALREPAIRQDDKTVVLTVRTTIDVPALQVVARKLVSKNWADETTALPKRLLHSRNNLRRLGRALSAFERQHNSLPPPAICGKDGKPLLSWRVAILPFLGETALYDEFKLNESWDSPHNKKLIARMPAVFAAPGVATKDAGQTYYQAVVGKWAGWELNPDAKQPLGAAGLRSFADFQNNRSLTVALAEAADPVAWTSPQDLPFEDGKILPKVGGVFKGKMNLLMFDMTPLTLRTPLADRDLRIVILRSAAARPSEDFFNRVEHLNFGSPDGPPYRTTMTAK
jgi:hypothetical protein